MRSGKLTKRLWSYFSLLILFFSALMGSVFAFLFVEYNRESHQEELRRQAVALAEALPQLADEVFNGDAMPERAAVVEPEHSRGRQHGMMGMRHGNSGSKGSDTPMGEGQWCRRNYSSNESTAGSDVDNSMAVFLRTLDKFTRGTVWVVDKNSRTISSYGEESAVSIEDMPASINEVLEETLRGGTPVVGTSTPLFDAPMVTAGAPVRGRDGSLLGAVLVHRHLSELRAAEVTGLKILGAALALGIISSIISGILTVIYSTKLGAFDDRFMHDTTVFILVQGIAWFCFVSGLSVSPKLSGILEKIVPHTFSIYLIHVFFIDWLTRIKVFGEVNLCGINIHPVIQVPLRLLTVFVLSFISVHLLSKIKKGE